MIGVVVAQLDKLQHAPTPSPVFGYYVLAVPLAAILQAAAILMTLLGAHRFWRQQNAMARGRARAGGWEIYTIMVFTTLVSPVLKR